MKKIKYWWREELSEYDREHIENIALAMVPMLFVLSPVLVIIGTCIEKLIG